MIQNASLDFIYFLLLQDKLPIHFFVFEKAFSELNVKLIPISVDQIQLLKSFSDSSQANVICSTINMYQYNLYNCKVRGILKFFLKSDGINFFKISSFSGLNDEKKFYRLKNYFFINYPQDVKNISSWIIHVSHLKNRSKKIWPGGAPMRRNLNF